MMSTSKPCTCCDLPSDLTVLKHGKVVSYVMSKTQHLDNAILLNCTTEKKFLKVLYKYSASINQVCGVNECTE